MLSWRLYLPIVPGHGFWVFAWDKILGLGVKVVNVFFFFFIFLLQHHLLQACLMIYWQTLLSKLLDFWSARLQNLKWHGQTFKWLGLWGNTLLCGLTLKLWATLFDVVLCFCTGFLLYSMVKRLVNMIH